MRNYLGYLGMFGGFALVLFVLGALLHDRAFTGLGVMTLVGGAFVCAIKALVVSYDNRQERNENRADNK